MNDIVNKLNQIKQELNINLLPENVKKGITLLGVTGVYDGALKIFETKQAMFDTPPIKDQMGIIYSSYNEMKAIDTTEYFKELYFPESVTFESPLPNNTNIKETIRNSDRTVNYDVQLTSTNFTFTNNTGAEGIYIRYTSADRQTFTLETLIENPIVLTDAVHFTMDKYLHDEFSKFLIVCVIKANYDGLYIGNISTSPYLRKSGYCLNTWLENEKPQRSTTDSYIYDRYTKLSKYSSCRCIISTSTTVIDDKTCHNIDYGYNNNTSIIYDEINNKWYIGCIGSISNITPESEYQFTYTKVTNGISNDYTVVGNISDLSLIVYKSETSKYVYAYIIEEVNPNNVFLFTINDKASQSMGRDITIFSANSETSISIWLGISKENDQQVISSFWDEALTQFTASTNADIFPGKIALGVDGVLTGDDSFIDQLDATYMEDKIYNIEPSSFNNSPIEYLGFNENAKSIRALYIDDTVENVEQKVWVKNTKNKINLDIARKTYNTSSQYRYIHGDFGSQIQKSENYSYYLDRISVDSTSYYFYVIRVNNTTYSIDYEEFNVPYFNAYSNRIFPIFTDDRVYMAGVTYENSVWFMNIYYFDFNTRQLSHKSVQFNIPTSAFTYSVLLKMGTDNKLSIIFIYKSGNLFLSKFIFDENLDTLIFDQTVSTSITEQFNANSLTGLLYNRYYAYSTYRGYTDGTTYSYVDTFVVIDMDNLVTYSYVDSTPQESVPYGSTIEPIAFNGKIIFRRINADGGSTSSYTYRMYDIATNSWNVIYNKGTTNLSANSFVYNDNFYFIAPLSGSAYSKMLYKVNTDLTLTECLDICKFPSSVDYTHIIDMDLSKREFMFFPYNKSSNTMLKVISGKEYKVRLGSRIDLNDETYPDFYMVTVDGGTAGNCVLPTKRYLDF